MKQILLAGPDRLDIGATIDSSGGQLNRVHAPITKAALRDAGIDQTDVFLLTDPSEATAIPIVRELRESVRIVVYTDDSVPPFASHLADLILDPEAIGKELLVEELLDTGQ